MERKNIRFVLKTHEHGIAIADNNNGETKDAK